MIRRTLALFLVGLGTFAIAGCVEVRQTSTQTETPSAIDVRSKSGLLMEIRRSLGTNEDGVKVVKSVSLEGRHLFLEVVQSDYRQSGLLVPLASVYCWFMAGDVIDIAKESKLVDDFSLRVLIPAEDKYGNVTPPKLAMKAEFLDASVGKINTSNLAGWELSKATTSYWMTDELRNH